MLVARGLVESRARAQALIMAGKVFSGDRAVAKAGDLLADDVALSVRGQDHPWVSRGGLKLDHALRHFGLSPSGLVCLDVGASTGGFSDVLLAHGAAINAPDVCGWTALHTAVVRHHKDVVELLLAKGADINAKDRQGQTALHLAVKYHVPDVAEYLRQHGARE